MNIEPIITPGTLRFIERTEELCGLVRREGAVDLIDLDAYRKNLKLWKEVVAGHRIETYLAHKATKSPSVLRATLDAGLGIDVSSLGELESALNTGFAAERIECTGPKNTAFLTKAAHLRCLISIDSIEERERLITIGTNSRILLRIADPHAPGRRMLEKRTKFGIRREHLERAYALIEHSRIRLEGFHVHMDGFDPQMRASIGEGLIELIAEANDGGLTPRTINLGGGIKSPRLAGNHSWQRLMQAYERELLSETHERTWDRRAYGMHLGRRGTIEGRANAEMPSMTNDPMTYLERFLTSPTSRGVTFNQLLLETEITLLLEPGTALLTDTGVSIVPVIGVKDAPIPITVCDTNMFNLGTRMFEPIADPLLLPVQHDTEPFETFITGNLCREDDVLMQRTVRFARRPESGDVLLFTARGAYQTYEQARPQLQPTPVSYVLENETLRQDT